MLTPVPAAWAAGAQALNTPAPIIDPTPTVTASIRPSRRCSCTSTAARSAVGGLEELDDVAGRVLEEDLLAARSHDDVVAERGARGSQPLDLGADVVDDEVDPVPSSGPGSRAIGHRPAGGALGAGQKQTQIAAF